MIKHLFKLIWNRKKSTLLLIVEVFLSFLVLFGMLAMFFDSYYTFSEPMGFKYQNVWTLEIDWKKDNKASVVEKLRQLEMSLNSFPEIKKVSITTSFSTPYSNSMWMDGYKGVSDNQFSSCIFMADDNLAELLNLSIIEGRWFDRSDDAQNMKPVVISKAFRDNYFGDEISVGKIIESEDENLKVIGVYDNYKYRGEFSENYPGIFFRTRLEDFAKEGDESEDMDIEHLNRIMLGLIPGTGISFEEKLVRHIASLTKGWNINIKNVEEMRDEHINEKVLEIVVPSTVAFFLILNVVFGLMGVLWYSINRRHSEIGLRRAIGASAVSIAKQILGEAMVLGTFAIIGGVFIAVQVPILQLFETGINVFAMGLLAATFLIYLIISVCAFYPSILASTIQPATALHYE
jgi:putative ABC transport system permease protein